MIDETVYKIALAGFLHDIGKFAERASAKKDNSGDLKAGFYVDTAFLNNNRDLYQPHFNNNYTHRHAAFTAAFIDHMEKLLPKKFNKGEWGLEDSFVNLAAGHHLPKTPLQWIIAIADRVSSGFDRAEFEDRYNREIQVKDYKKTRLLTIFEGLSVNDKWKEDDLTAFNYRYNLKELSPQNIFPTDDSEARQVESEQASTDYRDLFFSFIAKLEKLEHKQNIPLWFEHFDSLFMIYASHIPAATVGYVVPDVSLYDHCRTTSAIASALYQYHKETDTMSVEVIKEDYETRKFLLISGDFYGIQDFIFTEGGSTGKASAKLLRGRSFYVSLLSELAADMLCSELGLPVTSIILNAAGKFTILAHNTDKAKETVKAVEGKINDWLIKNFFGQASMGFSTVEASCNDFVKGKFSDLWERLSKAGDKKKYSKFDLAKHGGCVKTYLDSFDNEFGICPFCNKRPADKSAKTKEEYACTICHDHIFIGTELVKNEQIAVTAIDADLHGEKLLEPVFGKYQLAFATGELKEMAREGKLFKFWNIGISEKGNIAKNITAKFINGYVPKYDDEDLHDERYFGGRKSDKKKLEMIEQIDEKIPKTFAHIAVKALNFTDNLTKFKGIEALGILKADVDNLGLLFACGMQKERLTLSRLATMSRQLNNYFSIFLPHKLKTDTSFRDIYTVFAGGDDLFLIGAWNRIIELSKLLNEKFREYVCNNKDITISAGISVHKPGEPIMTIAESAEHALALSKSKNKDIKDRITVFGETVTWDEFKKLEGIKDTMQKWSEDKTINNAMLFRFNELLEMAKQEKGIKDSEFNILLEDMECLKWRARFKYTVVRNISRHLEGDKKNEAIEEVLKTAEWLETYGGALKIPLWQIIYNQR